MRAVALVDSSVASGGFVPTLIEMAPVPRPPSHYVRVRVCAAALNPVDGKFTLWSKLMERPGTDAAPFVLGLDGAGVIDALGDGVSSSEWPIGTRVAFHLWLARGDGCFAGYCVAHQQSLVRIPDSISCEDAAALPCAMFTAYKALVTKLRFRAGRTIVITAGNGGVGGFAIQLARFFGAARVIATCSASSSERVLSLGATDWIDYHVEADVAAAVRRLSPDGVDYVMDCVGEDSATNLVRALRMDGEMACVAGNPRLDASIFLKGYSFHDVSLGLCAYTGGGAIGLLSEIGAACMHIVEAGSVTAMVERRIALDEVPDALASIASGMNRGKVVVCSAFGT